MNWDNIKHRINRAALARHLGVSRVAVYHWKAVPKKHEKAVSEWLAGLADK